MQLTFEEAGPPRVLFGEGFEDRVAAHVSGRVLCIAQAHHRAGADRIAEAVGASVFVTHEAQVPVEVAQLARAAAADADWVIAHGGGTPIGIAKAIALERDVHIAAVPTTYSGSECTQIWGLSDDGVKTTGRDPRVQPAVIVYDPLLTLDLGRVFSLRSLLNALAHSMEALYAADATAAAREAARESLVPLLAGMDAIAADPRGVDGRAQALYGAWKAGTALNTASMGLHHKLAHVLGGLGTPHAQTHATLLPYTAGFNLQAAPEANAVLSEALGGPPGRVIWERMRTWGLSTALSDVPGLAESDLPEVVELALQRRYANPRPVDEAGLTELLSKAWTGSY